MLPGVVNAIVSMRSFRAPRIDEKKMSAAAETTIIPATTPSAVHRNQRLGRPMRYATAAAAMMTALKNSVE